MIFPQRLLVLFLTAILPLQGFAEKLPVWIGTSGRNDSQGIYRLELDTDKGTLSQPELAAEIRSPGFLSMHPQKPILYSVCSLPDRKAGVAGFRITGDGKGLELINTQLIPSGGAAHLTCDREGKLLFTAQYGAGTVGVFPLNEDGSIGPVTQEVQHQGSGPTQRQQKPHPHWVGTGPGNNFLFVPDLGLDRVVIYRIDHTTGRIQRHGEGISPPGSGPRHMKFTSDGTMAYVLNELTMTVTGFRYDADQGTLTPFQTIAALPKDLWEVPVDTSSEIRIAPGDQFIYTANRGHDSISVFARDAGGRLTFVERESVRGAWPRNFNLSLDGQWLIAAGANSNTLSLFKVDRETGGLVFTGKVVNVPGPICVLMP